MDCDETTARRAWCGVGDIAVLAVRLDVRRRASETDIVKYEVVAQRFNCPGTCVDGRAVVREHTLANRQVCARNGGGHAAGKILRDSGAFYDHKAVDASSLYAGLAVVFDGAVLDVRSSETSGRKDTD